MKFLDRLTGRWKKQEQDNSDYEASLIRLAARPLPATPPVNTRYLPHYPFSNKAIQIAAVGDIHGRVDLLHRLEPDFQRAAANPDKQFVEIYMGDYIDHSGNPKAVVDHLISRKRLTDRKVICLAGNHEHMLLAALESDDYFRKWLSYGGDATVISYDVSLKGTLAQARLDLARAIPPEHLDFLRALPQTHRENEFFFVHAGVRPGIVLDQQKTADLLWIREPFLSSTDHLGAIIVHGHTPHAKPVMRMNRIGLDTGAYRTGKLTALFITSEEIRFADSQQYLQPMPA